MGRIVAMGGGDMENGEMDAVTRLIVNLSKSKTPRVVSLPTASFDNTGDEPKIESAFRRFGASSFQTVTLSDNTLEGEVLRNVLLSADIIFVGGGNLKRLMDEWNRTGVTEIMREAYRKGIVLCGSSSGAMCWFDEGYDDCGENGAYMFVDCVGLIPYVNCPHFQNEYWQSFKTAVKTRTRSGIACENGAAFTDIDGVYGKIHGSEGGEVYFLDKSHDFVCVPFEFNEKL